MNTALYNIVVSAVKQASVAKQAADAQFAAVINHPATQTALAFEKQAFSMPALSQQAIDALIGTGLGAVTGGTIGALTADEENRLRNALIGAVLAGTALGAGGYYFGDDIRNLMGLTETPDAGIAASNVNIPADDFAAGIDTGEPNFVGSLIGSGIGIGAGAGLSRGAANLAKRNLLSNAVSAIAADPKIPAELRNAGPEAASKLNKLENSINNLTGAKRIAAGLAAPAALGVIGSLIGGNQ